jgi:hypothetical protein
MAVKKKDTNLTKIISMRFRRDKFDSLNKIAREYNISRPELMRKIILDFVDRYKQKQKQELSK